MPNQTLKITERSIETMSKFETKAALAQTYKFAHEKNMGFHMSYIGDEAYKNARFGIRDRGDARPLCIWS